MQYWKTHQKDIILKNLESVCSNKVKMTMWQIVHENRITYEAEFIEVSKQFCKIKIDSNSKNFDRFKPDEPFFVHVPGLDIILKKEKFAKLSEYIEFSLPSDIQLYEKRRNKRFNYKYQDHKNITFQSISKDQEGKPEFRFSCVLIDISVAGAGMVVNKEILSLIEKGTSFHLTNLTDQKLPEPFLVKAVYKEEYSASGGELYKVGIIFMDELDSISYKSINSIIEIKQKKTQGLSNELFCGLDFEDQVYKINRIEQHNAVLASNIRDNIEYLDKLRYMTTKMKVDFMKDINNDLLAVALRLSSKELVYELFSELTDTMQREFLEKMQVERSASGVCKAQEEILKQIREKESNGEIVLDPTAFITYV